MKSWEERNNEAEKRGCFTEEDKEAANYYRTCAVGERLYQLGESPCYEEPLPLEDKPDPYWVTYHNSIAAELADEFYYEVDNNDIYFAKETYVRIQQLQLQQFGKVMYSDETDL